MKLDQSGVRNLVSVSFSIWQDRSFDTFQDPGSSSLECAVALGRQIPSTVPYKVL